MAALQKFLQAEIPSRQWTLETFARRVPLSLSRVYQIVNEGQDNVRQDTFARIAKALGMTSSELHARIGDGRGELTADDLDWVNIGRLVPTAQSATVKAMIRAAAYADGDTAANPPGGRHNNRRRGQQPPFQSHIPRRVGLISTAWQSVISLFPTRPLRQLAA